MGKLLTLQNALQTIKFRCQFCGSYYYHYYCEKDAEIWDSGENKKTVKKLCQAELKDEFWFFNISKAWVVAVAQLADPFPHMQEVHSSNLGRWH